jgi:hypothetical protein
MHREAARASSVVNLTFASANTLSRPKEISIDHLSRHSYVNTQQLYSLAFRLLENTVLSKVSDQPSSLSNFSILLSDTNICPPLFME